LRAFLTSVLVTPASRSRKWLGWIRSWTTERAKPGPVAVAKAETPGTTTATAATTTSTSVAK